MRASVLLVLLASTLPAQYFDFAVTDDGRLYFSTPLATAGENSRFKVYRTSGDTLELFASGAREENPFGTTASAPLVSGDGSITGWALTYPCASPSCGLSGIPRTFFQLQGAGLDTLTATGVQISRNGRYLLASTFEGHALRIELPSQRSTDLGQFFNFIGPQSIADNGAALIRDGRAEILVYVPLDGAPQPIPDTDHAQSGVLSPAADRIAFERLRDGRVELVLGSTVLASAPRSFRFQPSFANDGTLLYLDPDGQPTLVPPSGAPRRLATIPGGVQRAILSGDGRVAWLASVSGRLLRVHTADSAIGEVIPTTPYLSPNSSFAFPGSVLSFFGGGVDESTRFQIGDTRLPLSAIGDNLVYVQIPWDYPIFTPSRTLTVQGAGSPFHQDFSFTAFPTPTVTFERDGQALKAAHQDFRGLLTDADPVRPGETIHVFARNLGPVDRPIATGERSPDPPARVTTPMACYLFEVGATNLVKNPVGLVVPFAGLSPGLIGIYHIDVTIPADWTAKDAALECVMDSGDRLFHADEARLTVGLDAR